MEDFKKTYQKWRMLLFDANVIIAVFVLLAEFLMYFVIKKNNLILPTFARYLFRYLAMPTIANLTVIVIGYILMKFKADSEFVNYIPSIQLAFICMVVASVHYVFSVTLGIFSIPVFTTVIFSDKKMTNRVSFMCYGFLSVSLIVRKISVFELEKDYLFLEEAIIAFVILFCAKKVCNVIIEFQKEKSNIIEQGYINQLKMQDQLNKDQKTGLYGNTMFMNTLEQIAGSTDNTSSRIALAILDIDDFKKVNDTYGHLNGDCVLITFADILKNNSNKNRFMARFGGEEFAVIFMEDEVNCASDFLGKIRKEFENQKYDFTDNSITMSIGLAFWEHGWKSDDLFNNADTAMYTAKANGKNRIEIFNAAW